MAYKTWTFTASIGSTNTNENHVDYINEGSVVGSEDYILSGQSGTIDMVLKVNGTQNQTNWKACTTVEMVLMSAPAAYPRLSKYQQKRVISEKITTRNTTDGGGSCTLTAENASVLHAGNNLYIGAVGYDSTGKVVRTTNMQYACTIEQGASVEELTDGTQASITAWDALKEQVTNKLDAANYTDATGEIPVVTAAGNLKVRPVEFAIDNNDNFVLRGTESQVIASIPKSQLGGTASDQEIESIKQDVADVKKELEYKTSQLKEDLENVESVTFTTEKGSTNVFDCTNIAKGKILKQDIGISTSETYQDSANGFVANQTWNVKKGDVIYITSAYCGLCVYDANGVLREHFNNGDKNHTITVDSAHSLRLYSSASNATYTTDFMLSINASLPNSHEAYKPDKKISNFIILEEKINENRQNVKDLSKSVNGIELSKNLLDNSSVIANKRPSNWANQTINDSYKTDGYHTFKAIPVTQNSTYYFAENGNLVNFGQLATYDKDGKYVSALSPSVFNVNGVNVGYIIPENIAYVRGESKTSDFSGVNFKLFNGRFEKKFLKYNESAYERKFLPVVVFDFDQVVEIDARFTILKKYGFVGNVVEVATNNYEITKKLIKMGYDISPYLGNHTWDYSTDEGIQNLTANIAEKLGGLEAVGVYNPTMISCSGHKYSDTMERILSSYKIDYVRCSGFIKNGVSLKKSMYENSYDTRIVVPIGLGSYNSADEFNAIIDSLVDGNVPLIMPFMHTFGYDADWITQEAFEKVVSHVSDLVKNGKALCMNMHDFVAYNDTVKSIHDDYVRNMSAIFS